jgi:hypothetical protein
MAIGILTFLTAVALLGLFLQGKMLLRMQRGQTELAEKLELARDCLHQTEQELGALCSASAGVGDHLVKLEQQVRRTVERQNLLELRASGERPYAQASQLINKGADIDELVDTCGLTRGEAELLVMMHRGAA